jgi:inositol-hexakisphosphate kinase
MIGSRIPDGSITVMHRRADGGKGYSADVDPVTGLIYARFPPHNPEEPDRGFLFGLKNLAESLEKIYNDERTRQIKSRDDQVR